MLKATAHGWVLNLIVAANVLHSGIRDTTVIFEEGRQPPAGDIAAFINRSGKNRATVFFIPKRIVCSAPKERYA
jgi:hypothetical protein